MAQGRPRDQRVVRNRWVAIYALLLILALFYISAHRTVQKERELGVLRARTMAEGPGGQVEELVGGWPGGTSEGVVRRQTGGQLKGPVQEQPEGLSGVWAYEEQGKIGVDGGLKILPKGTQRLMLTNVEYPAPEDYGVELGTIPDMGQPMDKGIYKSLITMIGDMKDRGLSPIVCSGYRMLDKQEELFNRKVLPLVKAGCTKEESYNLTRQATSILGSEEHCLGLTVNLCARRYHKLERVFEGTPESKWLVEHAQDYGFVMRYGENKTDIIEIRYKPWHYRYVGVEAANYMKDSELSLEEFYIERGLYG